MAAWNTFSDPYFSFASLFSKEKGSNLPATVRNPGQDHTGGITPCSMASLQNSRKSWTKSLALHSLYGSPGLIFPAHVHSSFTLSLKQSTSHSCCWLPVSPSLQDEGSRGNCGAS